jgi:hypothetical protein
MHATWEDTIGGFNAFVEQQTKEVPETLFTLRQFDHEVRTTYEGVPLKDVKPLTKETYVPRGGTALLDALGASLDAEGAQPHLVIIQTDGYENESKKYTKAHIKALVELRGKEGWTVMYLGADQDAFDEAGRIGIAKGATMSYDSSQTREAFGVLSATVSQTRSAQLPVV